MNGWTEGEREKEARNGCSLSFVYNYFFSPSHCILYRGSTSIIAASLLDGSMAHILLCEPNELTRVALQPPASTRERETENKNNNLGVVPLNAWHVRRRTFNNAPHKWGMMSRIE